MYAALSNGALRLVDTITLRFGGMLDIYYNNKWRTVCDDSWSSSAASVACRQLGFVDVSVSFRSDFGTSSQNIWLNDVACNGSESRLIDCSHAGIGFDNCNRSEEVGVHCIAGELGGFL